VKLSLMHETLHLEESRSAMFYTIITQDFSSLITVVLLKKTNEGERKKGDKI
jgi:hypothetical protein